MELREFISEVLTDIFDGVSAAQKRISDKGGEINPFVKTGTSGVTYAPVERTSNKTLCIAEFDVALTVADKEQKGGKIGVLLGTSESAAESPRLLKRPSSQGLSFPSRTDCHNSSSS